MTQNQKLEIISLAQLKKEQLGSQAAVARACDVSDGTISLLFSGQPEKIAEIREPMWKKLSSALGWQPTGWNLVETTNTRLIHQVCADARDQGLFLAISHRAGSGKTASLESFANGDQKRTFIIQAREWAKREFLSQLCRTLGIDTSYRHTLDQMGEEICRFFKSRPGCLLLIDEADKLKHPALRFLIPLYNACHGVLGVVIAGTDHLEKEIRNDVRLQRKGSDEILSRFGRRFIHLNGADIHDVEAICSANGIADRTTIKNIFRDAEPVKRMVEHGTQKSQVEVVEDLRRIRRVIQREIMRIHEQAAQAA